MQNSIKFVMDSVSQTTQALATQQTEIAKALMSISGRDADLSRVEVSSNLFSFYLYLGWNYHNKKLTPEPE